MTREEAIKELTDLLPEEFLSEYSDAIKMGIEALKQEPSRWIPVSEKLPNLNDYNGPKVWQKKVLITGYLSFDDEENLFVTVAFADDVVHNCVWDTVVVAWMPLPKPYKEDHK